MKEPVATSVESGAAVGSSALFGLLVRLKCGYDEMPVMEMLAMPGIEREQAKIIAMMAVSRPEWCGPFQVLFLRRDGFIELWDRELREGWPNDRTERRGAAAADVEMQPGAESAAPRSLQ